MRIIHWASAALLLGLAVGCEDKVTQSDVNEQRNVVQDRQAEVARLEREKPTKIERAKEEAQEAVDEDIKAAKEEAKEEKEQLVALEERKAFESDMETKLKDYDKQIDELQAKADKATGAEKVELEKKIGELNGIYENVRKELDELKAASGDVWSQMKISFEKVWTDATNAINSATDSSPET